MVQTGSGQRRNGMVRELGEQTSLLLGNYRGCSVYSGRGTMVSLEPIRYFARNPVCAVIVIICQKIPVWKVPKFAFCRVYSFDGLCVCPQNSRTIWHIFTTFYLQMYLGLVHKRTGPKGHVFGGKPRINIWLNTHASHYSFWSYYRQHTSAS